MIEGKEFVILPYKSVRHRGMETQHFDSQTPRSDLVLIMAVPVHVALFPVSWVDQQTW